MNTKIVDVQKLVKSPFDMIRISWEVDGSSGSTECEAWRGQYEIDCLEKAGYRIINIELAK